MKLLVILCVVFALALTPGIASPQRFDPKDPVGTPDRRPTDPTRCLKRCPVTAEYNPVCGTDGVDYVNTNQLNCAVRCGAVVRVAFKGTCAAGK